MPSDYVVAQCFPGARGRVGLSVVGPRVVVMEGNQHQQRGEEAAAGLSLAEHRERITAARSSLSALRTALWQVPSGGGADGLSGLLGEVDEQRR
jgi:hypothetical protein